MSIKGKPIAGWFNQAMSIRRRSGLAVAQGWIRKNVPAQFHEVIERNVRERG